MPDPELNRAEVWIAEHSLRILCIAAIAVLLAGSAAIYLLDKQSQTETRVERLEPQVTQIVKGTKVCTRPTRHCAELLEAAFMSCRRYPRCRAMVLAAVLSPTVAPEEVVPQHSPSAGQQPGPGKGHHGQGGGTVRGTIPAPKSSQPSPGAESPAAPTDTPTPTPTPGNSPEGKPGLNVCLRLPLLPACVHAEG